MPLSSDAMNPTAAKTELAQVLKLMGAMNEEVLRAIALRSLWSRCAKDEDVLTAVNDTKLRAFNIVRDALYKDLILTIIKLYDEGDDDLSFPRVLRSLATPAVRALLENTEACDAVEAKYREATDGEHCRSFRLFRNKILAHNDTRGVEQTAAYGHETALLKDTVWIATRLSIAIRSEPPHCDPAKEVWDFEADRFWGALIKGIEAEHM